LNHLKLPKKTPNNKLSRAFLENTRPSTFRQKSKRDARRTKESVSSVKDMKS
jgi:hypothetical protein